MNPDESKLVILETAIDEIEQLKPMKGQRTVTRIGGEQ
jgi:hypothetical protein